MNKKSAESVDRRLAEDNSDDVIEPVSFEQFNQAVVSLGLCWLLPGKVRE